MVPTDYDMILGKLWLTKWNPEVDWRENRLSFIYGKYAVHAQGEQNAAQYQEVAQPRDKKFHAQSSRAMTMAPISATVSNSEAISKGST